MTMSDMTDDDVVWHSRFAVNQARAARRRLRALEEWRSRIEAQFVVQRGGDHAPAYGCVWCGQRGDVPAAVDHAPGCLLSLKPRRGE